MEKITFYAYQEFLVSLNLTMSVRHRFNDWTDAKD